MEIERVMNVLPYSIKAKIFRYHVGYDTHKTPCFGKTVKGAHCKKTTFTIMCNHHLKQLDRLLVNVIFNFKTHYVFYKLCSKFTQNPYFFENYLNLIFSPFQNDNYTETCCICLDFCKKTVISGCCKHHFCSGCLQNWVRLKPNCPLCRKNLL